MKKKFRVVALLLALVFVFTACGKSGDSGSGEAGEQVLKVNNSAEPDTLHPGLAQGTHEGWPIYHMFEGLMRWGSDGELEEAAAESFEVNDDKTKYTFKLREGLKWSDGEPVTAADYEYAWKHAIKKETASKYAFILTDYIKNGPEYAEGKIDDVEQVGIKALDDTTLEVELNHPTTFFPELTAFYTYMPIPKHIAESNPDWHKTPESYVTNGPFQLEKWDHNSKIVLKKNPEFRDAENVKLAKIDMDILDDKNTEWQKYENNEYHLVNSPQPDVVSKLRKEKNEELHIDEMLSTYFYSFNTERKPFNNAKVRKALSMAIDRGTITENITQAGQRPAEGIVPFGFNDENGKDFRESSGNLIQEDIAEAQKLLEEGLKEEGMTKEEAFAGKSILFNTDESHRNIAQAVQEMWKKNLGVDVQLENSEFKVVISRTRAHDFDIARTGWISDYRDPISMINLWVKNGEMNDAAYDNDEFNKLISTATISPDQAVRMQSMRDAEKILMDDMPIMPLYHYVSPWVVKSNVKGVYKDKLNYPTLTYAEIEG